MDRFFRQYALAYHPASLHALSLSPSSTVVVLLLFTAFAVLLLGLTASLADTRLDWLLNQVTGLGLALAIVGVVQKAFPEHPQKTLVYGFWETQQPGNPFGPFINRNHFAGWMVMALPLVTGYSCAVLAQTWSGRDTSVGSVLRWLTRVEAHRFTHVGFCALLMGMALVLTGSRSGIASFAVAMAVFAFLALRQFQGRRARLVFAGYLAAIFAGAVLWAGTDATVGRFVLARTDAPGRLIAWQDTMQIIGDFPVFGTGMGTYGQAMLVYQTAQRPVMYVQAHNEYLQVLAEGGLLVSLPVLVTLAVVLAALQRRLTDRDDLVTAWVRIGAVAGLAGIAAQSLVEFSLQMPGNTALFVVILAVALHRRAPGSHPSRQRTRRDAHRV
jgi:O-antigen ligase